MAKRRRKGLRGLAGSPAEHEQRMYSLAASAKHLLNTLSRSDSSEQCRVAIGAVSDAAAAKEHSFYVKGSDKFRREMDGIYSAVMRELRSGICGR